MSAPSDWHPQDWIIVVEALAQWAGPPDETSERGKRAYELIEGIAEEQGHPAWELIRQVDDERHRP